MPETPEPDPAPQSRTPKSHLKNAMSVVGGDGAH